MYRKVDPVTIGATIARYVTEEALSDREIAQREGVSMSTIAHWRNRAGIAPADKFVKSFQQIYGIGALTRFRIMLDHHTPLAEIGRHFGFSREYARQVKEKLKALDETESHVS